NIALADSIERLLEGGEEILENFSNKNSKPTIIMVIGVNGVGKTTTIGKVANWFREQKKSVLIVAADTFRAAASEQLNEWAKRASVRIVKQNEGADPGSVVFDGLESAKAKKEDVVLIDTAGRLHNKTHLMEELKKIDRIIAKVYPEANYYKLLAIDATTGQNALSQVELFNKAVNIDGIVLTKLDGTAKGGVVVAINKEQQMPVVFVGVGEGINDLELFNAKDFARSLVGIEN
ncbi:MAG: signal recognition particle-docking protein FtsY, partial [Firmicutes bacterium]|nr:signal recognition particle-docking protein FtsY [Bacillota bacterium]